jgi:hypothetical protein
LGLCGASLCQQRGVGRETSAATAAGDQPRELLAQARDRVQIDSHNAIESDGAGNGARILKGVSIGAHAIIGAGSVVTTSIPEGVIAAGNPARVIREL